MTQTATEPINLNLLAPYPTDPAEQTPKALARHLTVKAYRHMCEFPHLWRHWEAAGRPKSGAVYDAYTATRDAVSAEYSLILALRGDLADDPAGVFAAYEDLENVNYDLAKWLRRYGIDPVQVAQTSAGVVV